MLRFAFGVTAVEIALTLGAAFLVGWTAGDEPYLTADDLRSLRIPYDRLKTEYRSFRLHADASWDTRGILLEPGGTLYVSLLINAAPEAIERRRAVEERRRKAEGTGRLILIEEPFPGETGYAVRERGTSALRVELVRRREGQMLVVQLRRDLAPGSTGKVELPSLERRARLIQEYLMSRLAWR